ncbi:membrane dipeptidase-domain-containing protein [Chiua virens]|nr:membrane dipeptidase-domain-containing protein [Chiua virens]
MPMHVDIPRLREGKLGGFFWSVYVPCAESSAEGKDFLTATWRVRDTLEQVDVVKGLMDKYPDMFHYALSSEDIKESVSQAKIASLLGVEEGHQLGNSIAVLRQYYVLGVRYVTLTHTCHNAFADSCGYLTQIALLHYGLSTIGFKFMEEMNRIGMVIDLSHTSDLTATQAILRSKAPIIWSHSSARAIHNVAHNVPDEVLSLIGTKKGKKDGIITVNFAPAFVAPDGKANVQTVADHVEHLAKIAEKKNSDVCIGSDYDGISSTPEGLEDVFKYPALIAELYRRGWNKYELAGLTGGNFLRVFAEVENVAQELQAEAAPAVYGIYDNGLNIPSRKVVRQSVVELFHKNLKSLRQTFADQRFPVLEAESPETGGGKQLSLHWPSKSSSPTVQLTSDDDALKTQSNVHLTASCDNGPDVIDLTVDGDSLKNSRSAAPGPSEFVKPGNAIRAHLISIRDSDADSQYSFVILPYNSLTDDEHMVQVHQGDLAVTSRVGLCTMLERMEETHGFRTDVVNRVYKQSNGLEETDRTLLAMQEAAREQGEREIQHRSRKRKTA